MMKTIKETLELALEALEKLNNTNSHWWQEVDENVIVQLNNAESALREALAQERSSDEQPAPVQPGRNHYEDGDVFERIAASKKQPAQQEPVECQYGKGGYACCEGGPCKADEQNNAPQPAQRKPLTDEQIFNACAPLGFAQLSVIEVARAIEAAHGIGENR